MLLHPHQAFFESIVIVARLGSLSPKMLFLLLLLLQNVDEGTHTDKEDKEDKEEEEEARAERQ